MLLIYRKLLTMLPLILLCDCSSSPNTDKPTVFEISACNEFSNDMLRVFCTEDQHHLTCQWIEGFKIDHPGIHTEILLYKRSLPLKQLPLGKNGLVMMQESHAEHIPQATWRIKFARDGIIGIINIANPYRKEIIESGLAIERDTSIKTGERSRSWIKLSGSGQNSRIKIYICADSLSTCKVLTNYLKIDPDEFRIIMTACVDDMIDSVRMDPLSMGLCCQRYAYDPSQG